MNYENIELDKLQKQSYKKQYIPYFISLIFFILFVIFLVLFIVEKNKKNKTDDYYHFIPIIDGVYGSDIGGAAQYQGKYDILYSNYFSSPDIYNLKSNDHLKILEHFKTYQQTSEYSCACGCIIMALYHLGKKDISERNCVEIANVGIDIKLNTHGTLGTFPRDIANATRYYGFKAMTNDDYKEGLPFKDANSFGQFVKNSLINNEPIIVLHPDWGGHYLVIIGYDDMGTEYIWDDVIITADPYDTTDHIQDGYNVWGLERFYDLWSYLRVEFITDDSQNVQFFIKVSGK